MNREGHENDGEKPAGSLKEGERVGTLWPTTQMVAIDRCLPVGGGTFDGFLLVKVVARTVGASLGLEGSRLIRRADSRGRWKGSGHVMVTAESRTATCRSEFLAGAIRKYHITVLLFWKGAILTSKMSV